MIPEEDRPPAWLRDNVTIDVQVEGLKSFSKALLEELDKNFSTHVPQVYDVMSKHACVGEGMVFAEMDTVVQRHHECLTAIVNLLRDTASGTYTMGKGAETVAVNYGDVDDAARLKASDIDQVIKPGTPGGEVHASDASSSPVSVSDGGLTDKGVQ
ncbi:hypothetical protein ACNTMW_03770 [Planosporangium sp. 12N6]|uniref:hypothetical protein n=1 Tax=Planosporangium spinosum TaxID=3402278 RepID=UPI003CF613F0